MLDNTHQQLAEFIKGNTELVGPDSLFGGLHEVSHETLKMFVDYAYHQTKIQKDDSVINSSNFILYLKEKFADQENKIEPIIRKITDLKESKGLIVDEPPAQSTFRKLGIILMDLGLGVEPEKTAGLYENALKKVYQDFPQLGAKSAAGTVSTRPAADRDKPAAETAEKTGDKRDTAKSPEAGPPESSTPVEGSGTSSSPYFQGGGESTDEKSVFTPVTDRSLEPEKTIPGDKPISEPPSDAHSNIQPQPPISPGEKATAQPEKTIPTVPFSGVGDNFPEMAALSSLVQTPEDKRPEELAGIFPVLQALRGAQGVAMTPDTRGTRTGNDSSFKAQSRRGKGLQRKHKKKKRVVTEKTTSEGKQLRRIGANQPQSRLANNLQKSADSKSSPEEDAAMRSSFFNRKRDLIAANSASPPRKKGSLPGKVAKGAAIISTISMIIPATTGDSAQAASHNIVQLILSFLL